VDELELFTAALGLDEPWRVTRTWFEQEHGQLDVYLDFPRGARFPCPVQGCGQSQCAVHDSENKTWRHMDFFQHKALLHARVPRVRCAEHGVHQVALSWARPQSGFTLLFEALLITYAAAMPVARLAAMVREHDTRIWPVLEHHVNTQRSKLSFAEVTKVGMDETAAARGQDYVSVFMDLLTARVLFATEGRDADTVGRFAADLAAHGGDPARISDTSSDMSPAFINGIGEHLPNAKLTFDRFHIMAKLGEKVDQVRRAEQKTNPALNKTRYVWLKNRQNLTAKKGASGFSVGKGVSLAGLRGWQAA
jgi:transposase